MPVECDGEPPPTWQLSGTVAGSATTIVFDSMGVAIEQLGASATLGHFGSPRLGWTASAGGVFWGRIDDRDIAGGASVAGTVNWLPLYESPRRPFIAVTGSAGTEYLRATADDLQRHRWWAFDLRAGVMVGKTLWDRVVPYAALRVFGGPVLWTLAGQDVVGGDRYHVTFGAGLVVRLPRDADVSAEIMPLGERSASLGFTWRL